MLAIFFYLTILFTSTQLPLVLSTGLLVGCGLHVNEAKQLASKVNEDYGRWILAHQIKNSLPTFLRELYRAQKLVSRKGRLRYKHKKIEQILQQVDRKFQSFKDACLLIGMDLPQDLELINDYIDLAKFMQQHIEGYIKKWWIQSAPTRKSKKSFPRSAFYNKIIDGLAEKWNLVAYFVHQDSSIENPHDRIIFLSSIISYTRGMQGKMKGLS